jgi:hypothetical protein
VPRKTKAQLQRAREIADSIFLDEYDRDEKAIRDASREIGSRPHMWTPKLSRHVLAERIWERILNRGEKTEVEAIEEVLEALNAD